MNILVADDSRPIRAMLRALLETAEHTVIEAEDGAAALRVLDGERAPTVALLDWNMPGLTGPDVCRRVRARIGAPFVYLVLVTTRRDRSAVLDGLRSGANDYIVKPFDEEALLARIQIGGQMVALHHSVNERVQELERVNRELEAFSRMVAHDLRNPLNGIAGFVSMLQLDQSSRLDDEGRSCLAQVQHNTERMGEIIDALLSLARVTRADLACSAVDLAALGREVVAGLRQQSPGRQVDFRVPPTLPAMGDRSLLHLVLQNLLSNAWKFTARVPSAVIELGVRTTPEGPVFAVRDNGAGFDMRKAARLFQPFQRMHASSEFEGTGIGLTIVQRIIERHRGCIQAESSPGRGACFQFTLGTTADAAPQSSAA